MSNGARDIQPVQNDLYRSVLFYAFLFKPVCSFFYYVHDVSAVVTTAFLQELFVQISEMRNHHYLDYLHAKLLSLYLVL